MDAPQGRGERALRDLLIHHSYRESQKKSHLGAALGNMVGDGWGTFLRQVRHSLPHSRLGQSQENLFLLMFDSDSFKKKKRFYLFICWAGFFVAAWAPL